MTAAVSQEATESKCFKIDFRFFLCSLLLSAMCYASRKKLQASLVDEGSNGDDTEIEDWAVRLLCSLAALAEPLKLENHPWRCKVVDHWPCCGGSLLLAEDCDHRAMRTVVDVLATQLLEDGKEKSTVYPVLRNSKIGPGLKISEVRGCKISYLRFCLADFST